MLQQRYSLSGPATFLPTLRDWGESLLYKRRTRRHTLARDPEVIQARAAVLIGGLPEAAVQAAERRGEFDWRPLAAALDTLYVAKGGSLGVRAFLLSPQKSLSGRVPVELIARKGELQQVALAAYNESVRADLSRLG
jgi:hypothetical protein